MPLGRRKVPFSAKQKKIQLKQKRERKRDGNEAEKDDDFQDFNQSQGNSTTGNGQEKKANPKKSNRYKLLFMTESDDLIQKQKSLAQKRLVSATEKDLEMKFDEIFLPSSELDFPKRPAWNYAMSKLDVENRESRYFQEYTSCLIEKYLDTISYFELNLETWRQLWRVLEMSDIILIIVDIRFPMLLFPPSLYNYIVNDLKKSVILILNKIDLAPSAVVLAWKHYFKETYPELHVLYFTSYPLSCPSSASSSEMLNKRRRLQLRTAAESSKRLLSVCKSIVQNSVDLDSWAEKIEDEISASGTDSDVKMTHTVQKFDATYEQHEKFKDGILTIGCVGHPNVGKSSVINLLMGKKVVSVSRTPGHTKHFQTIFLTPTVRLCDCPGLVFPSIAAKELQVLSGSFPIAQLRVPYPAMTFLAERIPIPKILKLVHLDGKREKNDIWSTWDICDAWASKRGFRTAKAARNDTYRAANDILRMALDGRLRLCLRPPAFLEKKEFWETHSELEEVKNIQEKGQDLKSGVSEEFLEESTEEESDESDKISEVETNAVQEELTGENKFAALNLS